MKRFLILFFTSLLALVILIAVAVYMKRTTDEFDSRHPALDDPLKSGQSENISENPKTPISETAPETAAETSGQASETVAADPSGTDAGGESAESSEDLALQSWRQEVSEALAALPETEEEPDVPEQNRELPSHRIIFVGDSRTAGMENAINKLMPGSDGCVFVAKVGEGCSWFLNDGMSQMGDAIAKYPDAPVVINLGVNDPDQIEEYLAAYDSMLAEFPGTDFWFMSVNPVQRDKMIETGFSDDAMRLVTNANITKLNAAIRAACPDRYLDASSMMKQTGFQTVDGLHYSEQTYLKIHRFVIESLFS